MRTRPAGGAIGCRPKPRGYIAILSQLHRLVKLDLGAPARARGGKRLRASIHRNTTCGVSGSLAWKY